MAYGTQAGSVRVVVRHPENIGQAPQLFQSYNVHTCPILRVVLGEKHLISGSMRYYVMMMSLYVHWWAEFSASVTKQPTSEKRRGHCNEWKLLMTWMQAGSAYKVLEGVYLGHGNSGLALRLQF